MRNRPKARGTFLSRSRLVTTAVVLVAGAALILLELPSGWIDLAALLVASLSLRPAGANRPAGPDPRSGGEVRRARRRIRLVRQRAPRITR
ncbi:hypothetical protein OH738_21575 [Streptomyces hirsutus]|uniref:Uncharacterized protein n=1 Tax=Streptomyces hirsutus TaxID=35620 RepID=A0ABZ1GMS9_9ACTN|nr:hypothetical protein [Streptomyces hirsutus]WSD07483.1 hypothetical protein OIE73_18095 [Streptomyces hirsutus]WTD19102.1 hypothetical protein OH738_21575 [Streptomyces hirsutus]WTD75971.1 hypothetical protein OHB56_19970 [Streptomyces sp. NBC_01635]